MFWADGPWHAAGGGGPACLIVGLLVIGAAIAGGLWWWKRRSNPTKPGSGSSPSGGERPSAEDILAERYARGDITDDEYMQRQSVLREGRGD